MKKIIKIETARDIAENALLEMPPSHSRDEASELEQKIIQYAKHKCKEQQELAKEHLFNVVQTLFLTSKEDMPYPKF